MGYIRHSNILPHIYRLSARNQKFKKLALPYYPPQDREGEKYEISSTWEKLVADYMGISLYDVDDMDYYDYLLIRRDAFIARLRQTESGQEYLDNAYRLTLTKPDRQALRENFGKGVMIGGKK